MPKTTPETARYRIGTTKSMFHFRTKIHRLRRLVAGDINALDDRVISGGKQGNAIETMMRKHYKATDENLYFYDILVQDFAEGRSNDLFQTVRTLVLQTANTFPEIEFEGLDPKLAVVNAGYCKDRMNKCHARHQVRMAMADYIISGMGCCSQMIEGDYPVTRYRDLLDMAWDLQAEVPTEMRWAATRITQPLYRWLELFSGSKYNTKPLTDMVGTNTGVDQPQPKEVPVTLWYYFDIDGPKGSHQIYRAKGEEVDDTPIFDGVNPYSVPEGKSDIPALPFGFIYHMALPSVKMPPSIVEGMIPAQVAIWEADRHTRDTIKVGKAHYEKQDGAYSPENWDNWMDSVEGTVLTRLSGFANPLHIAEPLPVSDSVLKWRDTNNQSLIAQGGANPYASGNKVEGIAFASEVQAIQGNAGLVSGAIAKDGAEFWMWIAKTYLAFGKKYDDMPCTIQFDDGIELVFDDADPIRNYLKPEADLVVQEDTILMMSKTQKVQMAAAILTQCMNPIMVQAFPDALSQAFEKFLRANGEKNIQAWLKPPQGPPPGPPGAPMPVMPPGIPPQGAPGAQQAIPPAIPPQGMTMPAQNLDPQVMAGMSTQQ